MSMNRCPTELRSDSAGLPPRRDRRDGDSPSRGEQSVRQMRVTAAVAQQDNLGLAVRISREEEISGALLCDPTWGANHSRVAIVCGGDCGGACRASDTAMVWLSTRSEQWRPGRTGAEGWKWVGRSWDRAEVGIGGGDECSSEDYTHERVVT